MNAEPQAGLAPGPRRPPLAGRPLPVALALALALVATAGAAQPPDVPCQEDPRHRALDFLVGAWDAVGDSGEVEGHVVVESTLSGCALVETSRAPGGADAVGIWHFDPRAEVWRVTRIDAAGGSYRLEGTVRGTELSASGEAVDATGGASTIRGTRRFEGGRILQRWEFSLDGGASWTELWRGAYVPAGTQLTRAAPAAPAPPPGTSSPRPERAAVRSAEPAAPSPPTETPTTAPPTAQTAQPPVAAIPAALPAAPSPEPSPEPPAEPAISRSGQVEARSLEPPRPAVAPAPPDAAAGAVAELTPRDRGARRDPIRMTSPMQLQFPIGPVEKLREGYGWVSTDTGAYQVDDVRLDQVEVARRARRGQVEVLITLHLSGVGLLANAAATVDLLDGAGAPIDSASLGRFPLGKSLTEQSQYGFITKKVTFSVTQERFDELFTGTEGAERPQLRVTLTTGESR